MPPQTPQPVQPQQGGSSIFTATDGTPLNPTAVTLAKAIRQVESGGNYNAIGDSGTSKGAYQFNSSNYEDWAKQYGLNPSDFSPTNQDKVAYARINDLLGKGYTQSQVASIWNSGNPDPTVAGSGHNDALGVDYDVPAYVNKVKQAYLQQANQPSTTPQSIPTAQAQTPAQNQPPETTLQKAGDVAGAVGNFLFPIVGDIGADLNGSNKKTALQQTGDAALSALPFIPGLGEVGDVARGGEVAADVAPSLLSKLAGNTVVKGAAAGYGTGVASNLSQGESLRQSVTPNAANILGAATGGVAGAVLPKLSGVLGKNFTQSGALKAVQSGLGDEVSRTVPGRTLLSSLPSGGQRALELISKSGATPEVSGTTFNVEDGIDKLQQRISSLSQARAEAIAKVAPTTKLDDLAAEAKGKITQAPDDASDAEKHLAMQRMFSGEAQGMASKIDKIVADIKATTGKDELTAPELEAFKEAQTGNSKVFSRTGAIGDQNAASLLGGVAKDKIENLAKDAGFPGMKEYNAYIKDHYDAIKVLQRLGKQTVKGGRLGNMLRNHTIAGVSAVAGAPFGIAGSLVGGGAGELAGHVLSKIMGETSLSNPLRDKIIERAAQEDPAAVQELLKFSGKTGKIAPLATPKSSLLVRHPLAGSVISGMGTKIATEDSRAINGSGR